MTRGIDPVELILASTSPYRRALLERLGVPFRALPPRLDEETARRELLAAGASPRGLADGLAERKAASLSREYPEAVLLGSDQLVACNGEILGKPGTAEAAAAQLDQLSGRTHELITAVAVLHAGMLRLHTDVARLRMRRLTSSEIARYVAADAPLDCAGAYKIESRGIALFEAIECADHTAITGLPLIAVTTLLREAGFAVP